MKRFCSADIWCQSCDQHKRSTPLQTGSDDKIHTQHSVEEDEQLIKAEDSSTLSRLCLRKTCSSSQGSVVVSYVLLDHFVRSSDSLKSNDFYCHCHKNNEKISTTVQNK